MKPGKFNSRAAWLLSLLAACFVQSAPAQTPVSTTLGKDGLSGPSVFAPTQRTFAALTPVSNQPRQFPWKSNIVTTVFWIGEKPSANNPTPNRSSSWDANWTQNYGGFDNPDPSQRRDLVPIAFTPRQNPFYCALPYNDKAREGHRPEAPQVVPWFREAFQGPGVSTCKGRWLAIRKGTRVAYAQWEDAGPFRTDHWQYVFGNERPKSNLNQGAGLDVSPAIRDYLGLQETDVTDWKFVEFKEVPVGPWARYGDNNTFVQQRRTRSSAVVQGKSRALELAPR
ncbi:MAG: hypothetical protein ACR2ID_07180 [Chthoniobacterales bacterium]